MLAKCWCVKGKYVQFKSLRSAETLGPPPPLCKDLGGGYTPLLGKNYSPPKNLLISAKIEKWAIFDVAAHLWYDMIWEYGSEHRAGSCSFRVHCCMGGCQGRHLLSGCGLAVVWPWQGASVGRIRFFGISHQHRWGLVEAIYRFSSIQVPVLEVRDFN